MYTMNTLVAAVTSIFFMARSGVQGMPTECQVPCVTDRFGQYIYDCEHLDAYCHFCRDHGYCGGLPAWFEQFFPVGWNPFQPQTCPSFGDEVKARCDQENYQGSTCKLSCADGYALDPVLYSNYSGAQYNYTHEDLMNFSVTCSNQFSTPEWTPNHFSCVPKEYLKEKFFTTDNILIPKPPTHPYPDHYIFELFRSELEAPIIKEKSDDGRRQMRFYGICNYFCPLKGKALKQACQQHVYYCMLCRMSKICSRGASRSMLG